MLETLQVLYFFVPAYIGNMVPVFVRRLPVLGTPLDFGREWRGVRITGDHKTWRGLVFGTVAGVVVFVVQRFGHDAGFIAWSLVDYGSVSVFVGGLMACGALLGDALESFFKRRRGIPPGKMWFFWDQVDFMFGALVVTTAYWLSSWRGALIAVVVVFIITILTQKIGYWLRLKDDPL